MRAFCHSRLSVILENEIKSDEVMKLNHCRRFNYLVGNWLSSGIWLNMQIADESFR